MSWAIVTGASGGIGLEFVRTLAEKEPNLYFLLVARREDKLTEIQSVLRKNKIRSEYMVLDLENTDAAQKIEQKIRSSGYAVRYLINNAGFGWFGRFEKQNVSNIEAMLQLNVVSLTTITRRIIPLMETDGHILNIASSAGYAPLAGFAVYAATKAFVLNFSMALDAELRRSRSITVSAICPGPVDTSFFERAQMTGHHFTSSLFREKPEHTARRALWAAWKGWVMVPTGFGSWLFRFLSWCLPRQMMARSLMTRLGSENTSK